MTTEYRIEYAILRQRAGETDFTEVGFGSSGTWSDLNSCAHAVNSDVQNQGWETTPGMPDPHEVEEQS